MGLPATERLSPEDWARVRQWFDHCAELSHSERQHFLALHEAAHPELVEEVRSLLRSEAALPKQSGESLAGEEEYEVIAPLGAGGMAEVFLARWRSPGGPRLVALKCLLPNLALDRDFLTLFEQEAGLYRILNHPNIVRMYDFRVWKGRYTIALEYIPGKPMGALIDKLAKGTPLPFDACAHVMVEAARGLTYAHALKDPATGQHLGLMHRDLTPNNFFLGFDGSVRLMDFGIARAKRQMRLTPDGRIRGTLPYLAPEQLQGGEADQRSDLFSLAAVFVEILTGRPFDSLSYCHGGGPDPLSLFDLDTPAEVPQALKKALALDPARRYGSVADLMWELRPCLGPETLARGKRWLAESLKEHFPTDPTPAERPAPIAVPKKRLALAPEPKATSVRRGTWLRRLRKVPRLLFVTAVLGALTTSLIKFEIYLSPLFGTPSVSFLPNKRDKGIVYIVPGSSRCVIELHTSPGRMAVTLDRALSGGTTPTLLALPCGRPVLVTLLSREGHLSHHRITATEPFQGRLLAQPVSPWARYLTWTDLLWDFLARLLSGTL